MNANKVSIRICDCGRYDGETHAHYYKRDGSRSQPVFTLGELLAAAADDTAAGLIDELEAAQIVMEMIDVLPQKHHGIFVYGVAAMESASEEALTARPLLTETFKTIGGFIQLVAHENEPHRPSAAA